MQEQLLFLLICSLYFKRFLTQMNKNYSLQQLGFIDYFSDDMVVFPMNISLRHETCANST